MSEPKVGLYLATVKAENGSSAFGLARWLGSRFDLLEIFNDTSKISLRHRVDDDSDTGFLDDIAKTEALFGTRLSQLFPLSFEMDPRVFVDQMVASCKGFDVFVFKGNDFAEFRSYPDGFSSD